MMVYFENSKEAGPGKSAKLLPYWDGPYKVVRQLTELNYRVETANGKKSFIAHVQRMRRYQPWPTAAATKTTTTATTTTAAVTAKENG
jgi:hypothetical protein